MAILLMPLASGWKPTHLISIFSLPTSVLSPPDSSTLTAFIDVNTNVADVRQMVSSHPCLSAEVIICLIIYRARCTLTDLDRLVPLLQESISLNGSLKDRVTAASLHWGDENHIKNFEGNPPGVDDIKLFNFVAG
jgi:hypothetical protein